MNELLNKYYEYFKENDLFNKSSINDKDEYIKFYEEQIINVYDLSKNKQLQIDLEEFFEFFDTYDSYGTTKGKYSLPTLSFRRRLEPREEISKNKFYDNKKTSFEWFKPTSNLVNKRHFLYTKPYGGITQPGYYCKAYLSIKPEMYVSVLIKFQEFIDKLYEEHSLEGFGECKFRKKPANDAIVMRFTCEEHYNEFLQFLKENKDIMDSYDTPNPFLPQNEYGISLIPDNGGSYNLFVARMIWDYMFYCHENKVNICVDTFVAFVSNYECSKNKELMKLTREMESTYKQVLIGKIMSTPNEELLSFVIPQKSKDLKLTKKHIGWNN